MGGIVGRLFREFSLTLSAAIIVSAIVSLTLTPMMCAYLLRGRTVVHPQTKATTFEVSLRLYERSLGWVMRHQPLTLSVAVATLISTIVLYAIIPKGFLPVQDTGVIVATTDASPDIPFNEMARLQAKAADVALNDPAVAGVDSFVGVGVVNSTPNTGRMTIVLKRRSERADPVQVVIKRLNQALAGTHGFSVYLQPAPEIQIGTRISRTQYQYILVDANPTELTMASRRLLERLQSNPLLQNVASDQHNGGLLADVTIDRIKAGRLGIRPQSIDDTLYDAFGQRQGMSRPLLNLAGRALPVDDAMRLSDLPQVSVRSCAWHDAQLARL